jgi:hypothetical protein
MDFRIANLQQLLQVMRDDFSTEKDKQAAAK